MPAHHPDAVAVSPAGILGFLLIVAGFRCLLGLVGVLYLIGASGFPLIIPGLLAFVVCIRAGWTLKSVLMRRGLCLSASMWIGSAAAVVAHDTFAHSVFLALTICSFAATDIMLSSMRMEKLP